MEAGFWHERWQENEIGFHQSDVNPFLVKHWSALQINKDANVLVPLCGKTKDMLWLLGQGAEVTGVELSELALDAFAAENNLKMVKGKSGSFVQWRLDALQLLAGDFFAYSAPEDRVIDAIYDRAALIALPESMRGQYADHIAKLLLPEAEVLLITLSYDQNLMSGPPFSVGRAEVTALFSDNFKINLLSETDVIEEHDRFKSKGLVTLIESAYRLVRC